MREQEILKQIDKYLKGKLSEKEVDKLWMEFLICQESFELFNTMVNFHAIMKERLGDDDDDD